MVYEVNPSSGLVYTGEMPPGVAQSNPLDVIIFDALYYAPIYRDGDFVVVPFDALLGVIEVKEVLQREQFVIACEQLHSVLEQDWCLSRSVVDGKFHLFSRDGWYYFYWRLVRQIYDRVLRRERAAWKYPVPYEVLQT